MAESVALHPMEGLGLAVVVVAVLAGAIVGIRNDPRITRHELVVQVSWIALYVAGGAAIVWMTLLDMGDHGRMAAGGVAFLLWLVVALPLLMRHLRRRLEAGRPR